MLKLQVFCERLGLETGWNCHISLAENSESSIADDEDDNDEEEQEEDGRDAENRSIISIQSVTDKLLEKRNDELSNQLGKYREGLFF